MENSHERSITGLRTPLRGSESFRSSNSDGKAYFGVEHAIA